MKERFTSERLVMRPLDAGDAEALHAGYGDAALMRWWSTPPHADVEETRAYLVGDDEEDDEDEWQAWAVTLDGEPIGTLSAGPRRMGVYEIAYLLVRRHWGRGYGREMVAALVAMLIDDGARRLYADVDPDNAASIALLEGLGFRLEGRLRGAWESHIGIRDAMIFGLLREEWPPPAKPDPAATKARAAAMLVRPVRLVGLALALFGVVLAAMPGVPRVVTGAVLALALIQIVGAAFLRRRISS